MRKIAHQRKGSHQMMEILKKKHTKLLNNNIIVQLYLLCIYILMYHINYCAVYTSYHWFIYKITKYVCLIWRKKMYLYGVLQKYIIEIHIINKVPFQKKIYHHHLLFLWFILKVPQKLYYFLKKEKFECISQQLKVTPKMAIKYSL